MAHHRDIAKTTGATKMRIIQHLFKNQSIHFYRPLPKAWQEIIMPDASFHDQLKSLIGLTDQNVPPQNEQKHAISGKSQNPKCSKADP